MADRITLSTYVVDDPVRRVVRIRIGWFEIWLTRRSFIAADAVRDCHIHAGDWNLNDIKDLVYWGREAADGREWYGTTISLIDDEHKEFPHG